MILWPRPWPCHDRFAVNASCNFAMCCYALQCFFLVFHCSSLFLKVIINDYNILNLILCIYTYRERERERKKYVRIYIYIYQSEGGGTAPHGIHVSLGALGWGAGCVEDFVVVVSVVVPGGWVARGLAESPRMLKKSGRQRRVLKKSGREIFV